MYIVTGGSGLIGSALVWELNRLGFKDILIVDHLGSSEKWKNLAPLQYRDYMEKECFIEQIRTKTLSYKREIKGIFHLGACSATTELDASYLSENNFQYSRDLATFAVDNHIPFVYASSCATYGDGAQGYCDQDPNIGRLRPLNMYGYSKQMFDMWADNSGILKHIAGCKFSNIYGPNELHKANMRSVVLRAYEQISTVGTMQLFRSYRKEYADGEQLRDFLYVKDAVKMIMFLFNGLASNAAKFAGIYNIGSGRAESWNALTTAVFSAMNKPVRIEYIDMPDSLKEKYQYYTLAETTKLRNLGYNEEILSLNDAVKDYVCNYLIPRKHLGDE